MSTLTANQPTVARVLIVEDHPIVRQGYARLIASQSDLRVVGYAAGEREALLKVEATRPDLVVVDITLQQGHGIDLVRRLRAHYPVVKSLVISAHDEHLFADRALESGAQGYINKEQATDHLIDGIKAVLNGRCYLSDAFRRRLLRQRVGSSTSLEPARISELTDRELEVFSLIGQGHTVKAIASQLRLSPKTVERYRENIKRKLRLANATELIQRATQWFLEWTASQE